MIQRGNNTDKKSTPVHKMTDERSSTHTMNDAGVQEQSLNNSSVHSSGERRGADSPWAKHTAKELMEDCPHIVALSLIDASLSNAIP